MRPSRVKAKLARNEPVLVTALHLIDPTLYELISLLGFDAIWLDLEHHATSLETAASLMRAARVGASDVMARAAKGEFMRIGRILEAGAQGIMYPRCDNEHEARQVVEWSKFAPLGRRGYDSANPDMPYCTMPMLDYLAAANQETFVVVQIEDAGALARADQIAALEGVDVLFLGPADFTVLGGIPGQFDHARIREAYGVLAQAAQRHGKHWGAPVASPEHAAELLKRGARFVANGVDILMVKNGMEAIRGQFTDLGFTFDPRV
jgi:4-hydroxy-2-oxoheptanedioate aldolase